MQVNVWKMLKPWLLSALVPLVVAGCAGITGTEPSAVIHGTVVTDESLAGAVVQILNPAGNVLGEAETDGEGRFELSLAVLPHDVRLVSRGGAAEFAGTFVGTLSAFVEDPEPDVTVSLTPVTTMVDRLRMAGPFTLAEAELRISSYLRLEAGRSVRSDFRYLSDFSSARFMREAESAGFDAAVESVVQATLEPVGETLDPREPGPFAEQLLQSWPLASTLGMELIKGAVSGSASFGAGKLLSSIGGGSADGMTEVLGRLDGIDRQLRGLQATVSDIALDVKDLKVLVSVGTVKEVTDAVRLAWTDLQNLERLHGEQRAAEARRIEEFILRRLGENRNSITSLLTGYGFGAGQSAMQIYADYLRESITSFYSERHSNSFINFAEYYDAVNAQLYYLLMEAENAKAYREFGEPSAKLQILAEEYEAARDEYRAFLPRMPLAEGMFVELEQDLLWYYSFTWAPGEYDPWWPHSIAEGYFEGYSWTLPRQVSKNFHGGYEDIIARGGPPVYFEERTRFVLRPDPGCDDWCGPRIKVFIPQMYATNGGIHYADMYLDFADFFYQTPLRTDQLADFLPWL